MLDLFNWVSKVSWEGLIMLVMLDQIGQDSYVTCVGIVSQSRYGKLGQVNQVRLDRLGEFSLLVWIN